MQVTIRCLVLLADAVELIERHGRLLCSPLAQLGDCTRIVAVLRMTPCDGLVDVRAIHRRVLSHSSVPTLFVPILKAPTDLPFRLVESLPS